MRILLVLISISIATACSSSIKRTEEINSFKLTIGEANKTNVIDQIGLPNKVEQKDGNEYWLYTGRELTSDLFIPLPIIVSPLPLILFADIGPSWRNDFKPMLICVFDNNDILINAFDPRKIKEGK